MCLTLIISDKDKMAWVSATNQIQGVVYFNQHLGAAHSKCWSTSLFSAFFARFHKNLLQKLRKMRQKLFTSVLGS